VLIGLRPTAFSFAGTDDTVDLEVVPLGVESLGDEQHVLFEAPATDGAEASAAAVPVAGEDVPVTVDDSTGTRLWTAKVAQRADLAIGRPVRLTVDLSAAYFFDPAGGLAIPEVAPAPTRGSETPTVLEATR
jgi:multiple sugar transport system ATP-binding protein